MAESISIVYRDVRAVRRVRRISQGRFEFGRMYARVYTQVDQCRTHVLVHSVYVCEVSDDVYDELS